MDQLQPSTLPRLLILFQLPIPIRIHTLHLILSQLLIPIRIHTLHLILFQLLIPIRIHTLLLILFQIRNLQIILRQAHPLLLLLALRSVSMAAFVEVLVSVLWGINVWFNLPITVNAFQIQLSTRLLTAPLPTRSAAQPPTVVIQERCASKAVALPFPPVFLSNHRIVPIQARPRHRRRKSIRHQLL